jgi:hypothetical protein
MIRTASAARSAAGLLIVLAAFVVHGGAMGRFWLGDDPQVLLHALRHSPVEILTVPDAWQELSTSNFTPLVTISFDLDLRLFGPEPEGFYIHQITVIALAAIAFGLLLRLLGVGSAMSLAAAIVFLAAPPVVHVAYSLMTRHYVEGLLFATLSLIVWIASARLDRRSRWRTAGLAVAAAVSYLLAMLAKEVFAPLPLVFLALAIARREEWRRVAVRLTPVVVAALTYIAWRVVMLGGVGGYGSGTGGLHLFGAVAEYVAMRPWIGLWSVVLAVVAATGMSWSRRGLLPPAFVGAAVLMPLFGIGEHLEPRHVLVPATVLLAAAVLSVSRLFAARPRIAVPLLAVAVVATVIGGASQWIVERHSTKRMEAEGRYVWEESGDALPLLASSPAWYVEGVVDLDSIVRGGSSPRRFYSRLGILLTELEHDRVIGFDDDGMPRVIPLEEMESLDLQIDRYEAAVPIRIAIERENSALTWSFGPDCDCTWIFYSYPAYQPFVLPESGRRLVPKPTEPQWFRVERRDRDGTWTLSPPLALPSEGHRVVWSRH